MKPEFDILLPESEVNARVDFLADTLSLKLKDDCIAVCLLTGGIWFASDITRALSRLGHALSFDCLWLSSYGDGHKSNDLRVVSPAQRPVHGHQVLLLDDVLDSGCSLRFAKQMMLENGASEVITAVFARKPDPLKDGIVRDFEVDHFAWEAPARYLVGYGLDSGGKYRELPFIAALD